MISVNKILQKCNLTLNLTNELNNTILLDNFYLQNIKFNKIDGYIIHGKTLQNNICVPVKIIVNEREQTIILTTKTTNGTQRTIWNQHGQKSTGLPNNQELLKKKLGL